MNTFPLESDWNKDFLALLLFGIKKTYILTQGGWFGGHQSIFRRRQWHPTPVLLPGKSHAWRSLVGCSPWGHQESDTTERLHFHFSLSCIGEGNGNPFQCSCLEKPRDGGAQWAAVYGVAQSRTRLKRLSSSSSLSSREGNGTPLQDSCLENPMDRGAWWAEIHGVAKESDTTE